MYLPHRRDPARVPINSTRLHERASGSITTSIYKYTPLKPDGLKMPSPIKCCHSSPSQGNVRQRPRCSFLLQTSFPEGNCSLSQVPIGEKWGRMLQQGARINLYKHQSIQTRSISQRKTQAKETAAELLPTAKPERDSGPWQNRDNSDFRRKH